MLDTRASPQAFRRQPFLILFFDLIAAFNISLLKVHRDPIVERRTASRREEQEARRAAAFRRLLPLGNAALPFRPSSS